MGLGAEEVGVPDVEQPHQHRHVAGRVGGPEVLVHGVQPGQELREPLRTDRDDQRGADRRARPSSGRRPSPRSRTRWPGRCRSPRPCRGRSTRRRSASGPPPSASWPASPSSSQALQSRALVSVSRVPKVLLETMNSVVAGSRPLSVVPGVGRVDVADEPALEAVLAVGLERLVGHHRTEVGAADADVDDGADPLAGHAGPRAGAHLLGEGVDPRRAPRARRRRRPGRRPRGWRRAGRRSAVCSTARSSVTLMCSPRNIASRRSATPGLVGQGEQRGQHLVVDEALGEVDGEVGGLERQAGGALRVRGEPGPQVRRERRREVRRAGPAQRSRRRPGPSAPGRSRRARPTTS